MGNLYAGLAFGLILVLPLWRILSRAGLRPAWSLLVFIPGVGFLIVAAFLAFARWPGTEGHAQGRDAR